MSLTRKRNMKKALLTLLMAVAAVIYIYPIILMLINSVKPFGEVVLDVIALPSRIEWSNYTYVIDKMKYGKLFFNNVIITVIGIIGIIAFSSMSAYILSRRKNRYTRIAALLITTPMLIPFQAIMITLLKVMNVIQKNNNRL